MNTRYGGELYRTINLKQPNLNCSFVKISLQERKFRIYSRYLTHLYLKIILISFNALVSIVIEFTPCQCVMGDYRRLFEVNHRIYCRYIHRQSLASKHLSLTLDQVLDCMVNVVNFIKSRPLLVRFYWKLCKYIGAETRFYCTVIVHNGSLLIMIYYLF